MSRISLSAPDVGPLEREYLNRAFDGGWIAPVGPELDGFEQDVRQLIGWPGVVALASGTAALHLALLECGVERGDDVLVSSFTFAASANAVAYCGAAPVFIDSDDETWNMNPSLLSDALEAARSANRMPKAAVVVDLYGQCANYGEIRPMLSEFGVALIEDAAEALGSSYCGRVAGTLGDIGVYSFNGNKIVTTSGGGMLVAPTAGLADRVRYLASQARLPAIHYEHTEIGYNYRLSNLLAAIGRAQLERLPQMSKRRVEISRQYRAALGDIDGIRFMPIVDPEGWNGWLTCVLFDESSTRDAVLEALDADEIESRPLWKPMHLQPIFADCRSFTDGTSADLFARGLCLPSGSVLGESEISRVCDRVAARMHARP